MQLYAFDEDGHLTNAHQARKQTNYSCLECRQIVRIRGGPQRQRHFYHLEPTPSCRQHQKGVIHLLLQSYFLQQLPPATPALSIAFLRSIALQMSLGCRKKSFLKSSIRQLQRKKSYNAIAIMGKKAGKWSGFYTIIVITDSVCQQLKWPCVLPPIFFRI